MQLDAAAALLSERSTTPVWAYAFVGRGGEGLYGLLAEVLLEQARTRGANVSELFKEMADATAAPTNGPIAPREYAVLKSAIAQ